MGLANNGAHPGNSKVVSAATGSAATWSGQAAIPKQYKWRAAELFVKEGDYTRIAPAEAAGSTPLANGIRKASALKLGREYACAASIGGPRQGRNL